MKPGSAAALCRRVLLAACAAGGLVASASAESPRIDWYSMNSGSAMAVDGSPYRLRGSIGQSVVGASWGGDYALAAGFWHLRRLRCSDAPDRIFCNGFEDL